MKTKEKNPFETATKHPKSLIFHFSVPILINTLIFPFVESAAFTIYRREILTQKSR